MKFSSSHSAIPSLAKSKIALTGEDYKSRKDCKTKKDNEQGAVVIIIGVILTFLLGTVAFSIDLGEVVDQKTGAQIAVDAGAFAAAELLSNQPLTATGSELTTEARRLANENGIPSSQITNVACGNWDSANTPSFQTCSDNCINCGGLEVNAVKVEATRPVSATFGKFFGVNSMAPSVAAIGYQSAGTPFYCTIPFGFESAVFDTVLPGDFFSISAENTNSGNWGKLDIGGNMSSGNNFREAMRNGGVCDQSAAIGSSISAGTGFGGNLTRGFNELASNGHATGATFAVVTPFPNGNGNVDILEFVRVDFLSQRRNGRNWQGNFRLVERNITPTIGGHTGGGARQLVE